MRRTRHFAALRFLSAAIFLPALNACSSLAPAEDHDFAGIVALSNCSGALVRFTHSGPDDKALVLTNGHCVEGEFVAPDAALLNRPSDRTFTLANAGGTSRHGVLQASTLVYATMSVTDIALYRLTESYADIERSYGASARTIAEKPANAGTPINIISGFWRTKYACSIDGFVHELKEKDWTFRNAIRYDAACDPIGGTSGAPIVDVASGEVVGVNNTGNDGGAACSFNNPCEVDEAGRVSASKRQNYGQQTYLLYGCLDSKNEIALELPGCLLPKH